MFDRKERDYSGARESKERFGSRVIDRKKIVLSLQALLRGEQQ